MGSELELRRHTDNEGDYLTPEGVLAAIEIGRRLRGGYTFVASSGAQRATQTAGCFMAGLAESVPQGVIVEVSLRSRREDEWRAAYARVGKGDLDSLREADPALVEEECGLLAEGLRSLLGRLQDGERALAVGHSPTLEAGVYGLTGVTVAPLGKGDGVLVTQEGETFRVRPPE